MRSPRALESSSYTHYSCRTATSCALVCIHKPPNFIFNSLHFSFHARHTHATTDRQQHPQTRSIYSHQKRHHVHVHGTCI